MNTAEMVQTLMADPTMTRRLAETMVTDWERMGFRHHNGRPVTSESIAKIARPSRLYIKAQRNAARDGSGRSLLMMIAKRRHPHGIA